ncbi:GIY-YIG nuclease family protein [Gloeobacter kilaueensis]|uniref:GIY-YIG nuclease family protein n=1 Tax=Gloeobacter kilaueensis TaxID=1416614 RepID=UPI0009DE505B|nr:GIY-YIG nuclease family protein [Gloeobacter kilaueensis]
MDHHSQGRDEVQSQFATAGDRLATTDEPIAQVTVYLVRCRNGALYCGQTSDLARRLELHASGKGARFVRMAGFASLAAAWPVEDRSAALRLEAAVKRLGKATKEALVIDPGATVLLAAKLGIRLVNN